MDIDHRQFIASVQFILLRAGDYRGVRGRADSSSGSVFDVWLGLVVRVPFAFNDTRKQYGFASDKISPDETFPVLFILAPLLRIHLWCDGTARN